MRMRFWATAVCRDDHEGSVAKAKHCKSTTASASAYLTRVLSEGYDWNRASADKEFRRGIELNPGSSALPCDLPAVRNRPAWKDDSTDGAFRYKWEPYFDTQMDLGS